MLDNASVKFRNDFSGSGSSAINSTFVQARWCKALVSTFEEIIISANACAESYNWRLREMARCVSRKRHDNETQAPEEK